MRKRLRKKKGEAEFAGYAFGVAYVLDDVSSVRANEFLDRFVEQAIEPNGLECHGGRHDREWDFRVACVNDEKPTKAQRAAVVKWLEGRKEVARFEVEELAT
jgi:uncharacterized protein YggL (DUF469 family)